ncbi:unnamed protein product [Rotaria sordida]|uniref:Amine oxidase domain-containing protein n=1 Tax=Rotaria sordida TaxID=392033 RepID=A0A819NGG4_9BILA|nr:unnamed protein product [Rotaria sordida]CAF3997778.1 unnamed protein product [Rotaria sordida]
MGEFGAMRFPLSRHPYLNQLIRERYKLNITEFSSPDDNAYTYINGILTRNKQARENPDMFQFNTSASERGKKYLALRQVHYICSSKILLFFNVSWWYVQEHISGGSSTSDLPIRSIYYPKTTSNQTDGGTLLASYTLGPNSIIWQSLSDSDAIELVLQQLIQIHRNSSNMRNYFQGGKVKHWCQDPHVRGAFAYLIPFQETELVDKLEASVSNVHFIGEYTSFVHGWVEGALSSAIRVAEAITIESEITAPTNGLQKIEQLYDLEIN